MLYRDKKKRSDSNKKYYADNRDNISNQRKSYRKLHAEEIKKHRVEYYEKNYTTWRKGILMDDAYRVEDELNFVAWIASNGMSDFQGKIKTDVEVESDGLPRRSRGCLQRIEFLRRYAEQWDRRALPEGWDSLCKKLVVDYITTVAIPTVYQLRQVQLGDLV